MGQTLLSSFITVVHNPTRFHEERLKTFRVNNLVHGHTNKQASKQTNGQTERQRRLHYLLVFLAEV